MYNDLYIESRFNMLESILYCKRVFASNFPLVFIVLYILLKLKREERKRERESSMRNLI